MNSEKAESYGQRYEALVRRLEAVAQVNRQDSSDEKEANALAYHVLDIEESCRALVDVHFQVLRKENLTPEEVHMALFDIGEELKHLLYHLHNSRYYSHLLDPGLYASDEGDGPNGET